MRTKRFQNRITAGRFTLPTAILISVSCWILTAVLLPETETQQSGYSLWETFCDFCIPTWANRLFSFILYAVIGYFLIQLNNTFAIILLISVCPSLHMLYAGDLAAASFLVALFFLFKSYQQARPTGSLFHAFVFIGLGSLLFPQLMLFAPIFWIGAYNFQSLQPKSFFASLVGWSVPYWLLLGHALGYLLVLFIVSAAHCLIAGYEDKIRTRSYLHFLILLNFCIFVYIGLQPVLSVHLMSFLLIGVSILAGHLFVLTNSRSSNIFFICAFIGLFILLGFNIWTLL